MFDKIKYYYEVGLWSKQRVWNVVGKVLTAEEYKEITGEDYEIVEGQFMFTKIVIDKKIHYDIIRV